LTAAFSIPLPRVEVPDESVWTPSMGATFHTGLNARDAVWSMPDGVPVAIDIETPNVTDSFSIKCVTAAWDDEVVLLDPLRNEFDAAALRMICQRAEWLILHNAPFDIPGLVAAGLLTMDQIAKVMDTMVLARMVFTDTLDKKDLASLAAKVLAIPSLNNALKIAQKAAGLVGNEKWFREGDIGMQTYRFGAMADTAVTLRLASPLFEMAVTQELNHPFGIYGLNTREEAVALVLRHQEANRVMLRRGARGMEVDLDYLDKYSESVNVDGERARQEVKEYGCRPGNGADVIRYLDANGLLPKNWPTTPKGALKADKDNMERLDHPLAAAHRHIAHTKKILGYMEKTAARSRITGRLHPQIQILGASATGRMSVSEPELQQFPGDARPIILADKGSAGVHSIDWSSIEPALMAWMAKDLAFIEPFENGGDLYMPIVEMAAVTRKVAKVVVLADMYGQGKTMLAAKLGTDTARAMEVKQKVRGAWPVTVRFMNTIKAVAAEYGMALTVSGRVLSVPRYNGVVADYKAINYVAQGSCADLIYDTIIEAERRGLGDYLMLPMHDEMVCATEAAQELQEIMETPPQRLIQWAGRRPVIRTDSALLGPTWTGDA
jgi:DNA polymerase-1